MRLSSARTMAGGSTSRRAPPPARPEPDRAAALSRMAASAAGPGSRGSSAVGAHSFMSSSMPVCVC